MNDAFAMSGVEGVGNFDGQGKKKFCVQQATGNLVFQSNAFQTLHGDESAAFMFAYVVDCTNVGMIQCRGCLALAAKPGQGLGILRKFFGKELQSDSTAQSSILGLVNHPHAPATEFFHDAVMRNRRAKRRIGGCHELGYFSFALRSKSNQQSIMMPDFGKVQSSRRLKSLSRQGGGSPDLGRRVLCKVADL